MKKLLSAVVCCVLLCVLAVPALAAGGPVITLQPQSPTYTQYAVALYVIKAEGENLSATWYMEWGDKTYTISKLGGAMQDWEPFAGESYGPRQPDANTFTYTFEGIDYDMDGAMIWCVISDGTNSVTSQKVRVSVKEFGPPPRILDIPARLTVEKGTKAELRCVATSPAENVQLTYRWFETKTGAMEDIEAVTEVQYSDTLTVDTSAVGTRNYLCQVCTTDGGIAYSSIVPVTVTEKATQAPATTTTTAAEKPTTTTESSGAPSEAITTTAAEKPGTSQPAGDPTQGQPEESTPVVGDGQDETRNAGTPWWVLVLVGLVAAGAGVGVAVLLVKKNA